MLSATARANGEELLSQKGETGGGGAAKDVVVGYQK